MAFEQIIGFCAAGITAAPQIDEDWLRAAEAKRTVFCDLDHLDVPQERV